MLAFGNARLLHVTCEGRFESREAEIQGLRAGHGPGEIKGLWIAFLGKPVDDDPSRIAESEELGNLVEGLPGRVVSRNEAPFGGDNPGEQRIPPLRAVGLAVSCAVAFLERAQWQARHSNCFVGEEIV